ILFFQKSTGKYTALTASTTKLQRVGKTSLSNCKKTLCRWEHAKSTFYLTTVTTSHNGQQFKSLYKKEPLNPRKELKKTGTTHKIENISVPSHLPALNRLFTSCLSRSILFVN